MSDLDRGLRDRIMRTASFWPSRAITTAVKLRLFTLLSGRRVTAPALAREAGLDPRALEVLLDALVALDFLEKEEGAYANRPHAEEALVEGKPGTLVYRLRREHENWGLWQGFEEVIRTGRPARTGSIFETDPDATALVLRSLHEHSRVLAPKLLEHVGSAGRLLDLGGGSGSYSIALCEADPALRATIFDLPNSIEVARGFVGGSAAADRIDFVVGDYRKDPLGGPYDLALVSNIIHGERPEDVVRLLGGVHAALEAGGRVIVRDLFLDEERFSPTFAALFSVNVLVHTEAGRCYSEGEMHRFLEEAGFTDVATLEPYSLIQAHKRPGGKFEKFGDTV